MRVLGIDLSFSPGLAVVDENGLIISKSLHTTTAQPWVERVEAIKNLVLELAKDVDYVYMENYAFNSRFGREVLGELGGIIKWYLIHHDKEPKLVSPLQVKYFATGRGKAPACPKGIAKSTWPKKWMMDKVNETFGCDFKIHDEADAFVVATIGRTVEAIKSNLLELDSLPNHQRAVVLKILGESEKYARKNNAKSGRREQSCKHRRGNCEKS